MKELKAILETQHQREFSETEVTKAAWSLESFARIMLEAGMREHKKKRKLEEFPKGYHHEGSGTCAVCGETAADENTWYDMYGLKCMICQKAINEKLLPASIAKDNESWYSKFDIESYFNIKGKLLNKCIKQGLLKDRVVPGDGKRIHLQLFLLKDNKDVLPPKKLLPLRIVKVIYKGEEHYTSESWYEYVDEALAKKLSKFRIVECFRESFSLPIDTGRFYWKEINPLFGPEKIWEPTVKNHDDLKQAYTKA